jgi:hypothetical protein
LSKKNERIVEERIVERSTCFDHNWLKQREREREIKSEKKGEREIDNERETESK